MRLKQWTAIPNSLHSFNIAWFCSEKSIDSRFSYAWVAYVLLVRDEFDDCLVMFSLFAHVLDWLFLEYVRSLSVNGPGPLTQQEQCWRLNNIKNTTQAVYVETSLLKGVKPRLVAQDLQPSSLIFSSKSETLLQSMCEKVINLTIK